ncbi:Spore maturation protein SpmB [Propionispira arboris]|jgi:spore maturation protein SpmB|uniref:Spore maturation protein SpmB n=1 Tax=Propionispira arboris TaxID=84035 RepID=A0A1H6Z1A0_9FIRM|nr:MULTISPECIES: YjiG family protein [Propionispira]SEJ43382.1 Spore maturation protein SpmB [Propionispira arboris]
MNKNPFDTFVIGARKGFQIGINNLLPNVLMAYTISEILKLLGVMEFIGKVFGPFMGIFGLPGEAITVLLTAWLSSSAGAGIAVNLYASGGISNTQATILLPAIFLMGAQLQYMGRLLGVADVPKKYWPALFVTSIVNSLIAMFILKIFA